MSEFMQMIVGAISGIVICNGSIILGYKISKMNGTDPDKIIYFFFMIFFMVLSVITIVSKANGC